MMTRLLPSMLLFLVCLVALVALQGAGAFVVMPPSLQLPRQQSQSGRSLRLVLQQTATNSTSNTVKNDLQEAFDKETLLSRLGGEAALEAAVDIFYDKVVADPALEHFFENTDMQALRAHQYKFMEIAFTVIPDDLDVGAYISNSHKRLLEQEGLNGSHFDLVAGHLVATLQGLGVADNLVDEVVATVGPLRAVFENEEDGES